MARNFMFFVSAIILALCSVAADFQPEVKDFSHTKIATGLPQAITEELSRIINYRFGNEPESNMLTTEVRGYVIPGQRYVFQPGKLEIADETMPVPKKITNASPPKFLEFEGEWLSLNSEASPEANVLGGFSTFVVDRDILEIPIVEANAESLAYYGGLHVQSGEAFIIESPKVLPLTVVRFEKNYEKGYLSIPNLGGGYYLETHDLPHFWSHLYEHGSGTIQLAKQVKPNIYHITAFSIPYKTGVYIPGHVIHCDALLLGDVMPIYSVTPNFSTVHVKTHTGALTQFKIVK